jgi:hypothetical protein
MPQEDEGMSVFALLEHGGFLGQRTERASTGKASRSFGAMPAKSNGRAIDRSHQLSPVACGRVA